MKRNNLFKFGALLVLPLIVWGCFEEQDFDLSDVNQVEWAPPNPASGSLSYTANLDADQDDSKTLTFTAQLIGAQSGSDRSVSVAVNQDESSAVEGQHFDLESTTVTFAANSSQSEVDVVIYADAFENRDELGFQLVLQDGDELRAAPNLSALDVDVEKDDVAFSTDLEGTDNYEDVSGSADVEGFAVDERFEAEISLEELAEEESYQWGIYRGTCEDMGNDLVGDEADYPELETGEEETSASAEAEIDVRIFQADELNVRVYDDALLGADLVTCGDLN